MSKRMLPRKLQTFGIEQWRNNFRG